MHVSAETIIRTIVLAAAMVNQILTAAGRNPLPFSDSQIYEGASLAVTFAASVWAWWKNNSFTQEALAGDALMQHLKDEKKLTGGDGHE